MASQGQITAWLLAEAAQYQANNGISTVTPDVVAYIISVAPDPTSAAIAIQALMGD